MISSPKISLLFLWIPLFGAVSTNTAFSLPLVVAVTTWVKAIGSQTGLDLYLPVAKSHSGVVFLVTVEIRSISDSLLTKFPMHSSTSLSIKSII